MPRDILTMRDVFVALDKANRVVPIDNTFVDRINAIPLTNDEVIAKIMAEENTNRESYWPTPAQRGSLRCECGNLLTIEDRYSRCRECMLSL